MIAEPFRRKDQYGENLVVKPDKDDPDILHLAVFDYHCIRGMEGGRSFDLTREAAEELRNYLTAYLADRTPADEQIGANWASR
jgi:hypothetical protein